MTRQVNPNFERSQDFFFCKLSCTYRKFQNKFKYWKSLFFIEFENIWNIFRRPKAPQVPPSWIFNCEYNILKITLNICTNVNKKHLTVYILKKCVK